MLHNFLFTLLCAAPEIARQYNSGPPVPRPGLRDDYPPPVPPMDDAVMMSKMDEAMRSEQRDLPTPPVYRDDMCKKPMIDDQEDFLGSDDEEYWDDFEEVIRLV